MFYGWRVAGAVFLAWAISIGPRQAFSVFLLAFLEEFRWGRSATAAAFSLHMSFYALGGCALGVLLDRIGPRRVIALSTAAWVGILILCSRIESLWQLYLIYGVLGGMATGGLAYVPNNAIISRWFVRYRGLATGISQAGVPAGTALFGVLAQVGVASIGWRWTHAAFGCAVALVSIPLVLVLLRDDPRELGLTPDGLPPAPQSPAAAAGRAASAAGVGEHGFPRGYWPIFFANMLRGITMYALLVHQVAYLVDAGYSRMAAATFYSVSSLLAIPSGLTAGMASDRLGRPRIYAVIAGLFVLSYVCLLSVRSPSHLLFLGLFILTSGMAAGANPPVFASLLTDRLQGPRLGFLLGLQNIGFGAGAMLGPLFAGALFDWLGSYTLAFLASAATALGSAACVTRGTARD